MIFLRLLSFHVRKIFLNTISFFLSKTITKHSRKTTIEYVGIFFNIYNKCLGSYDTTINVELVFVVILFSNDATVARLYCNQFNRNTNIIQTCQDRHYLHVSFIIFLYYLISKKQKIVNIK